MNKQELIEKYKNKYPVISMDIKEFRYFSELWEDLKQLDEPQKPVVPQFVANYIEYTKVNEWDMLEAMDNISYEDDKDLRKWFNNNLENFALTWINGYTVEKEKRYYVRLKNVDENYNYLTCIKHLNAWALTEIKRDKKFRSEHTKKQLEDAGFGWVFDCPGIEIEEVEG